MTKVYKKIVVVNESNEVIGAEYLPDAIAKNLLRRSVRIFVCNDKDEVVVQKRSQHVNLPGLLDTSAGGHVDYDETCDEAIIRELAEEVGITDILPTQLATSWKNGDSFSDVYKVTVPSTTKLAYDTEEVEALLWIKKDIIDEMTTTHPEQFAPAFLATWSHVRNQI